MRPRERRRPSSAGRRAFPISSRSSARCGPGIRAIRTGTRGDDAMRRRPASPLVNPLLSVVMPAYNERDTIEEIIRRVLAVPLRTELIVVDDGSKDGTQDILSRLAAELGFKLVLQPANGGKGAALRRGFREVTGDLVV